MAFASKEWVMDLFGKCFESVYIPTATIIKSTRATAGATTSFTYTAADSGIYIVYGTIKSTRAASKIPTKIIYKCTCGGKLLPGAMTRHANGTYNLSSVDNPSFGVILVYNMKKGDTISFEMKPDVVNSTTYVISSLIKLKGVIRTYSIGEVGTASGANTTVYNRTITLDKHSYILTIQTGGGEDDAKLSYEDSLYNDILRHSSQKHKPSSESDGHYSELAVKLYEGYEDGTLNISCNGNIATGSFMNMVGIKFY